MASLPESLVDRRRVRPRPDARHRRLAGALLRPAHRARRHVDHRALRARRARGAAAGWRRADCRCGSSPPASTSGSTSNAYIVPGLGRRRRPPVRRGLTMRFGVLGTGFWAKEVHAAALAAHPTPSWSASGAATSPRPRRWARSSTSPGYADVDELLAAGRRRRRSRCRPTCRRRSPKRAAAAGKHLLLEKPIALDVAGADRVVAAVRAAGVASVVFFTFRFQPETSSWLEQAGRTTLAGGHASWLSLAGRVAVRLLALAQGARRAVGHRPARAVGARPRARTGRLGAGRRRAPRHRPPGARARVRRRLDRHALPHRRPDVGRHRVLRARRRRPDRADPGGARRAAGLAVAVDELTAAAVTAGRIRATSGSAATSSRCWRPPRAP